MGTSVAAAATINRTWEKTAPVFRLAFALPGSFPAKIMDRLAIQKHTP